MMLCGHIDDTALAEGRPADIVVDGAVVGTATAEYTTTRVSRGSSLREACMRAVYAQDTVRVSVSLRDVRGKCRALGEGDTLLEALIAAVRDATQ